MNVSQRYYWVGLLTVITLIWSACGGDEVSDPTEFENGSLMGTVTLEGADEFAGVEVSAGDNTATTDAEGAYLIEGLETGPVEVTASFEGYLPQTETVEIEAEESTQLDFELQWENRAPLIESISASPQELQPGATATLEVVANDPDGDELSYQWSAPEDWELSGDDQASIEVTSPLEPNLTATIEVTVEDESGAQVQESIELRTANNAPPQITNLTATPPQAVPGEELTLVVEATDPEGQDLEYHWDAPDGWELISPYESTTALVAPDEYDVQATVAVTVTDPIGASTTSQLLLSTIANQGPRIDSLSADPVQVYRGGEIALLAEASHPQDDTLNYDWDVPQGWTLIEDPQAPNAPQLEAPATPGLNDSVVLTVTDSTGAQAVASLIVQTAANAGPEIDSLVADPQVLSRSGTSEVTVTASDPDGDSLSYDWNIDNDQWTLNGQGAQVTLTAPDLPGDSATVTMVVTDAFGASATASLTVLTEANQPPIIVEFTSDAGDWLTPGDSADLTAQVFNADGDALAYEWSTTPNWTIDAGDDEATVTSPNQGGQTTTVTLEVTDPFGGIDVASHELRTQDTAPDPFAFDDVDDVELDTLITSNAVTVDGFEGSLTATCTDCEVSVDGEPFEDTIAAVEPGDSLRIRLLSADQQQTSRTASLALGDTESSPWTVTTREIVITGSGTATDPFQTDPLAPDCMTALDEFADAQSGAWLIDGDTLVYCDMDLEPGTTYEGAGFGQFNVSYPDWELLGASDFTSSSPVRQAFLLHFNVNEGLENLNPGWNSGNCCIYDGNANSYTFRASDTAGTNNYMYPANFDGTMNCNATYNDDYIKLYLTAVSGAPTPSSYTEDDLIDTDSSQSCGASNNPGIFIKRYQ